MDANKIKDGLQPDKVKPWLLTLIKWLKILLAVLMFILGLITEGVQMDPSSTPQDLEETVDSLPLSLWGLAVTGVFACPLMLGLGKCVGSLLR